MKYLLTGAAGFIAARTAELLVEAGHEVVAVDNMNDYYDVRLKVWRLQRAVRLADPENDALQGFDFATAPWDRYTGPAEIKAGALHFHQIDIEDRAALEALFDAHSFDGVINLAARAGVRYSIEHPEVYMTTNALGPLHLLECMRRRGVRKFVLASTSSLYAGQPMPFREDLPVNTPISPYAASKKAAEVMAYTYHHLHKIDVSVVRYFTVYGPAGRPDMSPLRFVKWIDDGTPIELFGDGTQSRDFTYVDDIASGTIAALKPVGYEVINLGGGNEPISINSMIRSFEGHLGKKAVINQKPAIAADMKDTSADISKATRLLGWTPKTAPETGFEKTVEWYVENRDWARSLRL